MTLNTQAIVCTTEVRDEVFRNDKRYEDKAVSPLPRKVWQDFFLLKKLFMGNKLFWANLWWDYFTWGLMV